MYEKQKFFPEFSYLPPKTTKQKCKEPAFADEYKHRIGIFAIKFHSGKIPFYTVQNKCVNCGRKIGSEYYIVTKKLKAT